MVTFTLWSPLLYRTGTFIVPVPLSYWYRCRYGYFLSDPIIESMESVVTHRKLWSTAMFQRVITLWIGHHAMLPVIDNTCLQVSGWNGWIVWRKKLPKNPNTSTKIVTGYIGMLIITHRYVYPAEVILGIPNVKRNSGGLRGRQRSRATSFSSRNSAGQGNGHKDTCQRLCLYMIFYTLLQKRAMAPRTQRHAERLDWTSWTEKVKGQKFKFCTFAIFRGPAIWNMKERLFYFVGRDRPPLDPSCRSDLRDSECQEEFGPSWMDWGVG